ncbi:MAG: hypothetical protein CL938_16990 [Deltaproteobacteria bacterium]|nr:hypothetical protein [Deltaproteobacteria bacterium]
MLRKLGIEPGEGRIFFWSAAALFLLGWTDVSFKNVSETFFSKRVGVDYYPWAFLASSVLLVATTSAFGRMASRADRLRLLPRTFFVLGLLLIPLWLLVQIEATGIYAALLIVQKQLSSIALIMFWVAMGDLLHGRQAKRLFAPMMAGLTVGTILGSLASGPLGAWLGIDVLLPLSTLTMVSAGLVTLPLRNLRPRFGHRLETPAEARRAAAEAEATVSLRGVWQRSRLFRLLAISSLAGGLLGPMLYFQFQFVADLATRGEGGEQRLLQFYSVFRTWVGSGVLVAQIFLVGFIYRRFGVPLSAGLLPLIYLFGFFGLSVQPGVTAGVLAKAGTEVEDKAVYDPGLRVLYNLFPQNLRTRATALLEGPVKRAGGAIGNTLTIIATQAGSALWVGYTALPIAALWLVASFSLWRRYPKLLLEASAESGIEDRELLDAATVRALVPEMCQEDPARARVAVEIVSEADPPVAVGALAEAAEAATPGVRSLVISALDGILETRVSDPFESSGAAQRIEGLLRDAADLADADRADLVQAYGRLLGGEKAVPLLERMRADGSAAVQLAAQAALAQRGGDPDDLDRTLSRAIRGDDALARHTAHEEMRVLLLRDREDPRWPARLALLSEVFRTGSERTVVAETLAEVAAQHREATAAVSEVLLAEREDPDPRVRTALLRFSGHAGLDEQAGWLVDHLGAEDPEWVAAAREGLLALGPVTSNVLLRELAYGKRSKREAILEVIRELELDPAALCPLYEAEIAAVDRDLQRLVAFGERPAFALLRRRLGERVREELRTAILFLAAIRQKDRIAELGDRIDRLAGQWHERAIALEALESLLPIEDRQRLVPYLEDPDVESAAIRLTRAGPSMSLDRAMEELIEDPEELTRTIARGTVLATGYELEDDGSMDSVEKIQHLATVPIFKGLTVRQLMDLASVVKEHDLPSETVVVRQGEVDDCLYLLIQGGVRVTRGETPLDELGPGSFFGEIALFEGVPRTATVSTITKSRLLGLERVDLIRLIEDMPGISISLLEKLARRVRELTDQLTN